MNIYEPVSTCCGAPIIGSTEDPICKACLEHCDIESDEETDTIDLVDFTKTFFGV